MENNAALSRMDLYIRAIEDLFDNLAFDGWQNVFGDIPEDAEINDFREVLDSLNDFPEAARPLLQEIQEKPPRIEETPTILAYMCKAIRGLKIPPGFWDFEQGPVLAVFRDRFPHLQQEDGFEDICLKIGCGLYSIVLNFDRLYMELAAPLESGELNPIRRDFPYCFPAVEVAPPEAGASWREGAGAIEPPAAGRIYIPTHYSRSQLERLYRGLVDGGFVEDGREQDFLLCFDPGPDKQQGEFVWTARGEKNREQIVIQAACDLLSLLGIEIEDFGEYIEALCVNIPTFTKSARKKARQGWSRYYGTLKDILKSIENQ